MKTNLSLVLLGGAFLVWTLLQAAEVTKQRELEMAALVDAMSDTMRRITEDVRILQDSVNKLKPTIKVVTKVKVVYQDKPGAQLACNNPELPKNRIALGMGLGTDGSVYRKADRTVRERVGTVISADYARRFTNGNSVGVGVQSNKSVVIKLGKDF